jgi:hypothetical protein
MSLVNINEIINDGIVFTNFKENPTSLSALSLQIALENYFTTHHGVAINVFLLNQDGTSAEQKEDYAFSYIGSCFETIVHLQHFVELICKDLLRADHPLLAVDASNTPALLYKLVHNDALIDKEIDNLKSIEFRDALERIKAIPINKHPLIRVFQSNYDALVKLNVLRNRLWHRGTYFLKYAALDLFMGNFMLPFIYDVINQPLYNGLEILWKYKPLYCGLDLMKEISKETQKGTAYNRLKVALLKEFGRAAYKNPIWTMDDPVAKQRNQSVKENAEEIAKAELTEKIAKKVLKCPVCGFDTLLLYTQRVNCTNCSLDIWEYFGDPSSYKLLEDKWFD